MSSVSSSARRLCVAKTQSLSFSRALKHLPSPKQQVATSISMEVLFWKCLSSLLGKGSSVAWNYKLHMRICFPSKLKRIILYFQQNVFFSQLQMVGGGEREEMTMLLKFVLTCKRFYRSIVTFNFFPSFLNQSTVSLACFLEDQDWSQI